MLTSTLVLRKFPQPKPSVSTSMSRTLAKPDAMRFPTSLFILAKWRLWICILKGSTWSCTSEGERVPLNSLKQIRRRSKDQGLPCTTLTFLDKSWNSIRNLFKPKSLKVSHPLGFHTSSMVVLKASLLTVLSLKTMAKRQCSPLELVGKANSSLMTISSYSVSVSFSDSHLWERSSSIV